MNAASNTMRRQLNPFADVCKLHACTACIRPDITEFIRGLCSGCIMTKILGSESHEDLQNDVKAADVLSIADGGVYTCLRSSSPRPGVPEKHLTLLTAISTSPQVTHMTYMIVWYSGLQ